MMMNYECPKCGKIFNPEKDENGNPDDVVCIECGSLISEE
jgi:DNA-directed RNA polymerase subunit RPC12/RpoP